MKNSIEEDIKCVRDFLEYSQDMINDMDYERPVDVTIYQQQINSMQHILSDYKRVLKENEILKEEKEQAWEEWNNLEQGSYETEQRLKRELKGQVIKIEEITKLNQELVKENKIQDRIINKICNYICCTNYEDKIKIKEDDIVYYGEVGSIRKYFEDKIRKDK